MQNFLIIGLDPASLRNIGWSILELTNSPDKKNATICDWRGGTFVMPTMEERWQVIWPMFVMLDIFLTEKRPDLVILEKTNQFAQKGGGFVTGQVSHCMGAIYAVCGKHGVDVQFAYPTSVKKTVAGHGRATKTQVKKAVKSILERHNIENVKFDSEHTADAAATILHWLIQKDVIKPLDSED